MLLYSHCCAQRLVLRCWADVYRFAAATTAADVSVAVPVSVLVAQVQLSSQQRAHAPSIVVQ
jgi:hypothetical protein